MCSSASSHIQLIVQQFWLQWNWNNDKTDNNLYKKTTNERNSVVRSFIRRKPLGLVSKRLIQSVLQLAIILIGPRNSCLWYRHAVIISEQCVNTQCTLFDRSISVYIGLIGTSDNTPTKQSHNLQVAFSHFVNGTRYRILYALHVLSRELEIGKSKLMKRCKRYS